MKSKIALVAVMATFALCASPARADLTPATSPPPSDSATVTAGRTTFFGINNTKLTVPLTDLADLGGPGLLAQFNGTGDATIFFGMSFDPDQHGANADFILWTAPSNAGFSYTATLTQVDLREGANGQVYNFNQALNLGTTAGQTVPNRIFFANNTGLGATTGTPDFNEFDEVYFTITVTGAANGDTLAIDYVTNPEPGTLALFGLGLVGLGGIVVRRRRKLIAAQESNDTDVA